MKSNVVRKSLFVCMLVILMAVIFAYPAVGNIALGAEYGGDNFEDLWYYGEAALDFGHAKSVVENWDKSRLSVKVIAVIDTGIDSAHEIFDGVLYTDKDGNAIGYDARSQKEVPASSLRDTSDNKHGNSIAGVIAMFIKELGLENCIKIYPIKANSVGSGGTEANTISLTAVVSAINRAKEIGADVINMSFGRIKSDNGKQWAEDKNLLSAIYGANQNSFIVSAAGNEGKDSVKADDIFYPAGIEGVYSVMSLNSNGKITSNYGSVYDISAPGSGILSAYMTDGIKYKDDFTGSSLATPMAAVAGALLKLRYEAEGKTSLNGLNVARLMRNLNVDTVQQGNYRIKCLNLNTVLTQDFENTSFDYSAPKGLEIVHDGTLGSGDDVNKIVMHSTSVRTINFVAKVNPYGMTDPDVDNSIEWVLRRYDDEDNANDTVLGHGVKFEYLPKVYGEYSIVAILKYGGEMFEAEQEINIEYAPYLVGEVRVTYAQNAGDSVNNAPGRGVLYTTETTVFGLTGMEFVDKTVAIKWYVDDVLCGEGETFEYTPSKSGTHRISAQYGDHPRINTTYVFTAEVRPFIARPLDLSMLIIALAVVATTSIILIVLSVKKKRAKAVVSDESDITDGVQ